MKRNLLVAVLAVPAIAQQMADPDFRPLVAKPAYMGKGPLVLLDEAHQNFHTATGRYKPFADLLRSDGYRVEPNRQPFSAQTLRDAAVLVIANASGGPGEGGLGRSAFTDAECDAVAAWVRQGGSLLLVADHAPFGGGAEALASRFGVHMSKWYTLDSAHHLGSSPGFIVYDRGAQLGEHAITRGLQRVATFTGQSLKGPADAAVLLGLCDAAIDQTPGARDNSGTSAKGRAQGLAMPFGKGRAVVLGEAGMLSAQLIKREGKADGKMGMNYPGLDNQQFALNVLRWLSRFM